VVEVAWTFAAETNKYAN